MKYLIPSEKIIPLSGAVLSGILLALPWLGFPGYVLLFAFVPLLVSISYQQSKLKYTETQWICPFIAFLIWNLLATWWISKVSITGTLIIVFLNSQLMALVFVGSTRIQKYLGPIASGAFLLTSWLSFEYLHFHWELSWPWLTLGNGMANLIERIQWYEYTGVLGGSVWIILCNLLLYNAFFINTKRLSYKILPIIVIILPLFFSSVLYQKKEIATEIIKVGIIQPNIEPVHQKYESFAPDSQLDLIIKLANSLNGNQISLFVGPETALHQVDENQLNDPISIQKLKSFLASNNPDAAWIIGAISYRNVSEDATKSFAGPVYNGLRYFNSAFFVDTSSIRLYHKAKLVAGVEKMPFARIFSFLDHFKIHLEKEAHLFSTDKENIVFQHNNVKVALPICYESVYGEYLGKFVRSGANLFVLITNDGWWNQTPGYKQHLMMSRLRAIEHRRWIVRSANTGISAIIDDKGRYVSRTNWWERVAYVGEAALSEQKTFYSLYGDYLGKISLLTCFVFLIVIIFKRK